MSYVIYSDVSIDIAQDYLKDHPLGFVPMEYVVGDETRYCQGLESDEQMHRYYELLRQKVETHTSQITPYHYVETFEPLVREGKGILYICLSSGLSNTYDSARMAVNMLREDYEDAKVEVIDSLGGTGGMGILAESAFENQKKGMSLEENADWLRRHAGAINYWFMVEDLMYLKRGGRVSAASAVVGTVLDIKPILTINPQGKLDVIAKKRGSKPAMKYMLNRFKESLDKGPGKVVYINCSDCMDRARELRDWVLEFDPDLEVKLTMLSPVIGAHTGPDMIALIHYGTGRGRQE